jgi:hypothetical protein
MPKPMARMRQADRRARGDRAAGHVDFILPAGYRKEIIVDYFETRCTEWRVTSRHGRGR